MLAQITDLRLCTRMSLRPYVPDPLYSRPFCLRPYVVDRPLAPQVLRMGSH